MTDSLLDNKDPEVVIDDTKKYFDDLVGTGRKFKDQEELAKGKWYADELLRVYEAKMDQQTQDIMRLREENMAKASLTDLLDQWQTRDKKLPDTTTPVEEKTPAIQKDEIASLIDSRIHEKETAKRQTENYNQVKDKLVKNYGANYKQHVSEHMEELGLDEKTLNDMARNQPKALLRMLGLDEVTAPSRDPFRAPPQSNTRPGIQQKAEKRTWDWYQNLKEKNPKEYYHPKTNIQMHKDALELGEAFEDGDFGKYNKDFRIKY